MKVQRVCDWMTPHPKSISANTTLDVALKIMEEGQFRHLLVMSGNHLVSMISKSDIRRAELVIAASYNRREMKDLVTRLKTVSEIMSYRPQTIEADAPISEAAGLLLNARLSALPVMEENKVVGIITESDIFRMVLAQGTEAIT